MPAFIMLIIIDFNRIMNQTSFGNLVRFDHLPLLNSEERFTA